MLFCCAIWVCFGLRKKPNEGRMKGLAFALDPDGYWVELLRGGKKGQNTLAQTMLRVKELEDGGFFWHIKWVVVGLEIKEHIFCLLCKKVWSRIQRWICLICFVLPWWIGRWSVSFLVIWKKDPKKSLEFYTKHLGMTLLSHHDYEDFSLYYLGTVPEGDSEFPDDRPVLELTHNHGTEQDENFQHYNGNEAERKGFGHLGFLVDDATRLIF